MIISKDTEKLFDDINHVLRTLTKLDMEGTYHYKNHKGRTSCSHTEWGQMEMSL